MNKKILFGILTGAVVIIAAIYIFIISAVQNRIADASAVKGVVMEFGEKMKNISLQSPKEVVEKDIKKNYSGLVTDELLASWIADFSLVPGKVASSPWPTGIRIQDIKKIDGDKYKVLGKVIEVTSIEEVQGGAENEYNIEMIVEKRNGKWLIAEYKNLNLFETADWQVYKNDLADFAFKYPRNWEIGEDYLYETGGGTKAEHRTRTIVLCDKKTPKDKKENCIQINVPQAPENERTKIIGKNYLNLYSDDPEIIKIYEKVAESFKIYEKVAESFQIVDNIPLKEIVVDQNRKNEEIEIGYGIKYELIADAVNKNEGIIRFYGADDPYLFRNAPYSDIYFDNFFSIKLVALSLEEILIINRSEIESRPKYTYIFRDKTGHNNFSGVIEMRLARYFRTDSQMPPFNITAYPKYFKIEEENYCCDTFYASEPERENYRKIFYLDRNTYEFLKEEKVERHLKDESMEAEKTLNEFFTYLKNKEYEKAVGLLEIPEKAPQECSDDADEFDGCPNEHWDGLKTFSPQEDENSKAKVLENYTNGKKEATLKANVLEVKKYSEGKYILTVQFLNSDGSILVEGPCCGAMEEEMPSVDKFEYKVKKVDGVFKVITAPWHRP